MISILSPSRLFLMLVMVLISTGLYATPPESSNIPAMPAMHISTYDTEDPIPNEVVMIANQGEGKGEIKITNTTKYVIEIRSEGTGPCTAVVITSCLDEKMSFVGAQGPTSFHVEGNIVTFEPVPVLESGERLRYIIEACAKQVGSAKHKATLTYAECPKPIICEEGTTIFKFIDKQTYPSALHIGSFDTEDPVEVGKETIFCIEARNEGMQPCSEIKLTACLDNKSEFVAANGPTDFCVEDGKVIFEAVPSLEPGQKISYKITVRLTEAGAVKHSATFIYKEFDLPLTHEESTTCYPSK